MPTYTISAPDGNTYSIEGPEGATQQDVIQHVLAQNPEAGNPPVKEAGLFAGVKKGIEQLTSQGRTVAGAVTGDANEAAKAALARNKAMEDKYADQVSPERIKDAYNKQGILSAAGEAISQSPYAIAEQLPNFAASFAGAKAGASLGRKAGAGYGVKGQLLGGIGGGLAGAFVPSYVQSFGGNIERQAQEQEQAKQPINIDTTKAGLTAVPQAALDVASDRILIGGKLFGKMIGVPEKLLFQGGAEGVEKLAKERFLATIAKGTVTGAVGEIPTEVTQQMLERYQAGLPIANEEAFKEYGDTALTVGLIAPIGAAGRFAEKSGAKAEVQQKVVEQRREADAAAAAAAPKPPDITDPAYLQQIQTQYQEAEQRKAALKSQLRKVQDGSVTETADRLHNKDIEEQIKAMTPDLEELAKKYNEAAKVAPAFTPEAVPGPIETPEAVKVPEAVKPTTTVGDALDNPLGRFTKDELPPEVVAYIDIQRKNLGKPALDDYSIEDIRDALPDSGIPGTQGTDQASKTQTQSLAKVDLNSLIAAKTGYTPDVTYKPEDIINVAKQKNIATDTDGFKFFLQRATGENNLTKMEQPQLHSAFTALSGLPQFDETQYLPEKTNATHYSPQQYNSAVQKVSGLASEKDIPSSQALQVAKKATGLTRDSDVQLLLQNAYANGDLNLSSKGDFITAQPAEQAEFKVEEGFTQAQPTGFNVMRGDQLLYSTQNEAEAKAKVESLGKTADPAMKQIDKSIAGERSTVAASQRSLDIMEAAGMFRTPKYQQASAEHAALSQKAYENIQRLNEKKAYLQQPVTIQTTGKPLNVKTYKVKEKGVSEKAFNTREEALKHALENLPAARLKELAGKTKAPGFAKRLQAEIERRKAPPKPFLAAKPEPKVEVKVEPKPEKTAEKEAVKSQILPMLKKFGLGDVALQIEEGMQAEGSYAASVIKVALDANNPVRVLRHESIHGLKDLGFFTPGQWKVLENQADKVWIDKYLKQRNINGQPIEGGQQSRYEAYMNLYDGDINAVREEAIADAFGDFDVNGAPKGLFATLLQKMQDFFRALRSAFTGAGYETADDVFGKIERGELKATKVAKGKDRLSAREMQKGVVAEVAPNPDQEIAKQWDTMSQADKLATTKSVTNKVVKNVLDELGLDGYKVEYSTGTYEGKLNPNILIRAPSNASIDELTELSKVIGYVLDQKAMVSYDENNTSSNSQAGFVKVNIPKGMNDTDLTRLRNHISKEVPQADADTLRGGSLLYGNFSEFNDRVETLTDEQYHGKILDAISSFDYDGKIQVSEPVRFHSELAWPDSRIGYLEGTRYGTSGTDSSTEGADVRRIGRSNLDNISTDAISLRNRWIEQAARSEQPTVRPSRGGDEGITLGEQQDGALAFDGIHYGRSKSPVLMGSLFGSGLKGAERDRLSDSSDGRIKKRVYFYTQKPDGSMPMVESGVGNQVHTQRLNNMLPPGAERDRISRESKGDFNTFESKVVDAGYDGYAVPDMGMMVVLNHDVPTTYHGTVVDLKASGKLKNNRIVLERNSLRSDSYGLNILNDFTEKPNFGKKPTVDQVAQHFDQEIQARFGRKLDYNNPEDMARAVQMAADEIKYQMKSEQSGMDWYEEDIKRAFKDTAKVIPSLKSEPKRQIFSIMAGILSPQTNARDNWFIAAKAFEHYEKTGVVLGVNPDTGGLWQGGTQSANKKKQMEFLNSMIQNLGEKQTLDWLTSKHTVKEINQYRLKYGKITSGIDGKLNDEKPGLYAFGPKVGPFVSNINGIHDVTVDKWATRTFNRYFGTMADANGSIIDAPTEPQRRAVKELMNGVAKDANIKNYQVQSALWFYEQKLFRKLGTDSPSYGFSQGSEKFLEQRGGGGVEGLRFAKSAQAKLSLRTAPDTPEFKRFFGNSKIVDANGEPKLMYHGTARDIKEFKPQQAGAIFITDNPDTAARYSQESAQWLADHAPETLTAKQMAETVKTGAALARENGYTNKQIAALLKDKSFFKTDEFREAASKYLGSGSNIMPVYVSAQNPFDYQNKVHLNAVMKRVPGLKAEGFDRTNNWTTVESPEVQKAIRDLGFDSFYVSEHGDKNLAVYEPTQIKSATGNIGTYDINNPDIRYSLRTAPDWVPQKIWDLHEKASRATDLASGRIATDARPQDLKREQTMSFRRLNKAVEDYVGKDFNDVNALMVRMNEETGRREREQEDQEPARYSLREFRKDDLPQDEQAYTIPEDTLLFHGAYKAQADKIEAAGKVLLARPEVKTSGGYTNEGGLIFFGEQKTAEDWSKNLGDPMSVRFDRDAGVVREKGVVFQTITDRPYKLINKRYKLSANEAEKVTEALGLPEYKSLNAGNTASLAADRGDSFNNSKAVRYEVTKSGRKQTMSAPWPIIFDALGVDGYFDDFGIAISAENGIKLVGKEGKMERYSLRTDVAEDIRNMPNGAAIEAAINRVTTARQEVGYVERMTTALAGRSETFAYLRQKALDRYNRLNDFDKLVAQQMGGVAYLADQSAHAAALQSDAAAGVAASALGVGNRIGGTPVYRNGYTTVSNENGTVKGAVEIFSPLAKYGDPKIYQAYQFWAGAKRGKRLMASGKEELYTPQDMALAKQLEEKYPEFVSVQKEWIKYNNGLVKYAVDTGVVSAQNAEEFTRYSDYVPFYRQLEGERTIGPNIFQSISGVKGPQKITGSEAPLADFLETVVRNTQSIIQAGMKNVAAQKAVKGGMTLQMVRKLDYVASGPNTVTILENGQKVSYECADKLWVDAVSSLNLPELPFLNFLAMPANFLRAAVTKDPGFMLANLMRDSVSAYVTSGAKLTPVASAVKEFGNVLMNNSPEYQKLLSAGVLGGYEFSRNVEASAEAFAKDLRKKTGTKTGFESATSPFTFFWDALEKGTEASDAATRIAIYKATLAETGNEAEAIHRALEVMNFNRKGSSAVVRIAAAAIPFLNARVQGLDVFFRAGIRPFMDANATEQEKQVQKAMIIRGMTILGMSVMYAMAISGNPDYEKQEEETKDNNWIIPMGEGKTPLKIPIPFEVGTLFKTIPERIYRSFFMENKENRDTTEDLQKSMWRALQSTFGLNPVPQIAAPLLEARDNYSVFTQRPIVGQNMQGIAPEFQVGPGTSKWAEILGQQAGMSPMMIDHVFKGYTGTMGVYAADLLDAGIGAVSPSEVEKPSKRIEQMPIIKRFLADPEARGKITSYFDLKHQVDTTVRTINMLEKQADPNLPNYVEKNAQLFAARDFMNGLNKQMDDLQKQANMIRSAPIPADEKQEMLREITKAQNLLVNDIRQIRNILKP